MSSTAHTFLGYDYQIGTCDCCGREELKRTVKLAGPHGTVRYGVGCAARALGMSGPEVNRRTVAAQKVADETASKARAEANAAEMSRWTAHLIARTGGIRGADGRLSVLRMIQALGGMTAARVGYAS